MQCFFFVVSGDISPNGQCLSNWRNFSVWSFLVAKFRKKSNFENKIARFYPKVPAGSQKIIKRLYIYIFETFKFSYRQIWLNGLMDDRHLSNITKLEKKRKKH